MSAKPKQTVDVCVVTWNTATLTADALRHLLDTDQGCDVRVLVHDNASGDGTVEELARRVPEAHVVAGAENLGFAAAVNRLLDRSRAPYVFLLNSDAWPEPGAIGRLVAAAADHPRAAAIAPRLERPDGSLEHSTHPFPSVSLAWTMAFRRRRLSSERAADMMLEGAWHHDRPRTVDWAVGAALLIPRPALEAVGGFDERFFMYVEDLEWCWRARRRGFEIWFEPSAVVRHVGNVSGAQRYGAGRTDAYYANTHRFFRREHGGAAAAAYRALNLIGATKLYFRALRAGDRGGSAYWLTHVRANLRHAAGDERAGTRPRR